MSVSTCAGLAARLGRATATRPPTIAALIPLCEERQPVIRRPFAGASAIVLVELAAGQFLLTLDGSVMVDEGAVRAP